MRALGNLLVQALRIVPDDTFEYRLFESYTVNDIGNKVNKYGEWITARGSIQPGLTHSFNARGVSNPGEIAKALGLDLSKNIITVFAKGINIVNVNDKATPDQIRYRNKVYNVWSVSNWYNYDDWKALICMEDSRHREHNIQTEGGST